MIWPLLVKAGELGTWSIDGHEVSIIDRFRHENGRFGVYTTPAHMRAAKAIVLGEKLDTTTPDTQKLSMPKTGVALFYAAMGRQDRDVTIGFALLPPPNGIEEKIKWGVLVEATPDEPIVDAPPDEQASVAV